MERGFVVLFLVLALLQNSDAQTQTQTTVPEWFAANVINGNSFSPQPIQEIFPNNASFSTSNPIIVVPNVGVTTPDPVTSSDFLTQTANPTPTQQTIFQTGPTTFTIPQQSLQQLFSNIQQSSRQQGIFLIPNQQSNQNAQVNSGPTRTTPGLTDLTSRAQSILSSILTPSGQQGLILLSNTQPNQNTAVNTGTPQTNQGITFSTSTGQTQQTVTGQQLQQLLFANQQPNQNTQVNAGIAQPNQVFTLSTLQPQNVLSTLQTATGQPLQTVTGQQLQQLLFPNIQTNQNVPVNTGTPQNNQGFTVTSQRPQTVLSSILTPLVQQGLLLFPNQQPNVINTGTSQTTPGLTVTAQRPQTGFTTIQSPTGQQGVIFSNQQPNQNSAFELNTATPQNSQGFVVSTQRPATPPAQTQNPVANQQPQVSIQQPQVLNQRPTVISQQPQVLNQQPQVLNQQPQVSNRQPQVLNQEAQILNQQPQVSNRQPQVQNQGTQVLNQQPQVLNQQSVPNLPAVPNNANQISPVVTNNGAPVVSGPGFMISTTNPQISNAATPIFSGPGFTITTQRPQNAGIVGRPIGNLLNILGQPIQNFGNTAVPFGQTGQGFAVASPNPLGGVGTPCPDPGQQVVRVRMMSPNGQVANIQINPIRSTLRPIRSDDDIDDCVDRCSDVDVPICAAPLGARPINPDALRGFPTDCHLACHNTFRRNLYEKILDGRCGRLRTQIRTVNNNMLLRRDDLNRAQYTIVQDPTTGTVNMAPVATPTLLG